MRLSLPSVVTALLLLPALNTIAADAEGVSADYLGSWKQIASNAGRCERCEIDFERDGADLRVEANNGWAVRAKLSGHGSRAVLKGKAARQEFSVTFHLEGNELYLEMMVPCEGRPPPQVNAT